MNENAATIILNGYADSYDRMRAEDPRATVLASSVAYDIKHNMIPAVNSSFPAEPPTVGNLNILLEAEDDTPIEILPDGSIRPLITWAALLGAIARGWCEPCNSGKVMDPDLANAIAEEVRALYGYPKFIAPER